MIYGIYLTKDCYIGPLAVCLCVCVCVYNIYRKGHKTTGHGCHGAAVWLLQTDLALVCVKGGPYGFRKVCQMLRAFGG